MKFHKSIILSLVGSCYIYSETDDYISIFNNYTLLRGKVIPFKIYKIPKDIFRVIKINKNFRDDLGEVDVLLSDKGETKFTKKSFATSCC